MQRGFVLTESQRKQLVALLNKFGKKIFPGGPVQEQPAAVHADVKENRLVAVPGNTASALLIRVTTGHVLVFDDHAEFRPVQSDDVFSTSALNAEIAQAPASGPIVSEGIGIVESTKPQAATEPAVDLAASPGARLVPVRVTNVTVMTRLGLGVMMIDYVTGAALSALLLVAGILLLRNSPAAIGMHWTYALLKIPLAVLAAAGNWYFLRGYGLMSSGARVFMSQPWLPVVGGVVIALFGAAYPVVLICVLRSRAVRLYVRGGDAFGERKE